MSANPVKKPQIYIGDITFDAASPRLMAEFWAAALHYDISEITDDLAVIVDPAGQRPRCCFQLAETPKTGKNRVHLDLFTPDMEAEVQRLAALGARIVRAGSEGEVVWTVMRDVEGNEFCVQPPQY